MLLDPGIEAYTRHTRVFGRDARLSHPIAALRLLPIEPAITRRRALLSGAIDAPRFPENPHATGISPVGRSIGPRLRHPV